MRAKKMAASMVGSRMYTCHEVCDRLCRKGISHDTAEQVVCEFVEAGILNDQEYARMYIIDAVNLGTKGMSRIRQELWRKGIGRDVLEAAEADAQEEIDPAEVLRKYIEQRNLLDGVKSRNELEKLKAKLLRRGFSHEDIRSCLRNIEE